MKIVQGDARRPETYAQLLGERRADLLLTDPPYCLLTRRRKGGDLRDPKGRKIDRQPVVRFETVRDYRAFTAEWLPLAARFLTPGAPLIVWTNFLGKEPLRAVARDAGFAHEWGEFVWAKRTTEKDGNEILLRVYETALVLARTPAPALRLDDRPRVWSVVAGYDDDGEAAAAGSHPHHKPFGVMEALLREWSRPGQLVLDPFGGSGSTAAACARLGRDCATAELEPEWAERIRARLERLSPR